MKKTVLVNLSELSCAVGRPPEHLLTLLGHNLSAASKTEKGKSYVAGHHDPKVIQTQILAFIQAYVMCKNCGNPETSCGLEGSKKNKVLFLNCKSCGKRKSLDSTDRFVKYMMQHLPPEAVEGHAQAASGCSTAATMALASQLADDAALHHNNDHEKKQRQQCAECGHRTSKSICSRCGRQMSASDNTTKCLDDLDCYGCIQQWMQKHENEDVSAEMLLDFDATVKSCDFRFPIADQLQAVIEFVSAKTVFCCILDSKVEPAEVSRKADKTFGNFAPLIASLYERLRMLNEQAGTDVIFNGIRTAVADNPASERTKECITIGILLCLSNLVEAFTDCEILAGCQRLPIRGNAMMKFMEFLASNSDNDDNHESGAE
jgi:hypothetical protein